MSIPGLVICRPTQWHSTAGCLGRLHSCSALAEHAQDQKQQSPIAGALRRLPQPVWLVAGSMGGEGAMIALKTAGIPGSGGDCEIRTHGRLPVGSFQDCWFKPLTQVSGLEATYSSCPPAPFSVAGPWRRQRPPRSPGPVAHMPSDLSSSSVSLEGTGGRGASASASARVCAISASGSGVSCGSKSYSLMNSVRSMASSR